MNRGDIKTTTVKEVIQERDSILNKLMDELATQEELLMQVMNQSNEAEQKAFEKISFMIDMTLGQIDIVKSYYEKAIRTAATTTSKVIIDTEYRNLLDQICLN